MEYIPSDLQEIYQASEDPRLDLATRQRYKAFIQQIISKNPRGMLYPGLEKVTNTVNPMPALRQMGGTLGREMKAVGNMSGVPALMAALKPQERTVLPSQLSTLEELSRISNVPNVRPIQGPSTSQMNVPTIEEIASMKSTPELRSREDYINALKNHYRTIAKNQGIIPDKAERWAAHLKSVFGGRAGFKETPSSDIEKGSLAVEQAEKRRMLAENAADRILKSQVHEEAKKANPEAAKAAKLSLEKKEKTSGPSRDPAMDYIQDMLDKANELKKTPKDMDWSGLMNFVDAMYGTKMASTYKAPTTQAEAIKRAQDLEDTALLFQFKKDMQIMNDKAELEKAAITAKNQKEASLATLGVMGRDINKNIFAATNKLSESVTQLQIIDQALKDGSLNKTTAVLGQIARLISGEKGVLTNQDINRALTRTIGKDFASLKAYFTNNPNAKLPEGTLTALRQLTAMTQLKIKEKYGTKLEELEAIYGNDPAIQMAGLGDSVKAKISSAKRLYGLANSYNVSPEDISIASKYLTNENEIDFDSMSDEEIEKWIKQNK